MADNTIFNLILVAIAGIVFWRLSHRSLRDNERWQATLTPLSSIIGSGFLIMAPLVASIVGKASPFVLVGIVVFAYSIGHVMRFNIMHVEPRALAGKLSGRTKEIEYLGNIVLVLAYAVAVAFYLSLLSSFLLNFLGIVSPMGEAWMTTGIILFIMAVGYARGLSGLEKLESVSMTVQLSIVVALITGLAVYGISFIQSGQELEFNYVQRPAWEQMGMIAGALLMVQGFETSRFLGEKYSPEIRVKSMRDAQLIAGAVYLITVVLFMPVVQTLDLTHVHLAKIIDVTGLAALFLPAMLMIAALMSQFSAAVADTGGGGGLLRENSNGRLTSRLSYLAVGISAILLVWAVDLMAIIALASRAFASYYLLQTLLALYYCYKDCDPEDDVTRWNRILFMVVAAGLAYVVVFSIPAE